MIIKIRASPLANKRLRADIQTKDGIKQIDFGFKTGYTFVDGATSQAKDNYWKRHLANGTEKTLITNLVPSPSLLSAFILWGYSRDIGKNVKRLNDLWQVKHLGK
jgi:hypothetical protein